MEYIRPKHLSVFQRVAFHHRRLFALCGWLIGLASGCATPQAPPMLTVPPVSVSVDHYLGSPLTGPLDNPPAVTSPKDAYAITATFIALDRMPTGEMRWSLASQARIIAVTRSGLPVQSSARLAAGVRGADGDDATALRASLFDGTGVHSFGRAVPVTILHGALPTGATSRFALAEQINVTRFVLGQPVRRRVELSIYRPTTNAPVQIALVLEDLLAPLVPLDNTKAKTDDPEHAKDAPITRPKPAPVAVPVQELALLDRPAFTGHDSFALLVPYRFGNSESRVIAILIEIDKGSIDDAHQRAFATAMDEIAAARKLAATRPYSHPLDNPEWPGLLTALDAMAKPHTPRPPMVFLASQTGVEIFEDIALVGDDALRRELADKIFKALGVPVSIRSTDVLAWTLEHASYEILSEHSAVEALPGELAAILTLHAGEAGRHAGSLDDALRTSTTRREFDLRLIAENYIYLEDSSPASRVRAFDWLYARGRAPAGFDPLGPAKERRAALEQALNPAPATLPTTTPSAIAPGDIR